MATFQTFQKKKTNTGLVLIFGVFEDIVQKIKFRDITLRYGLHKVLLSLNKPNQEPEHIAMDIETNSNENYSVMRTECHCEKIKIN